MKLLALDTATEQCSVAFLQGTRTVARSGRAPRVQAETLLPMVEEVLAEAGATLGDLDAIAFGRGPGAFTGLRVATAVAQGLAFGAGLPVVPVSDLAAVAVLAWRVHGARRVLSCFDARLDEIYVCTFEMAEDGSIAAVGEEQLISPAALVRPDGPDWFGAGSGWGVHADRLRARLPGLSGFDPGLLPAAEDIAKLAAREAAQGHLRQPEEALPVYLRDKVATPRV